MDDYIKLLNWIFDRFGPAGLLVGYFIARDILQWWKSKERRESGTWVDFAEMKKQVMDGVQDIKNEVNGFTKFTERILGIEEKQNELLRESAERSREAAKSLERIEQRMA